MVKDHKKMQLLFGESLHLNIMQMHLHRTIESFKSTSMTCIKLWAQLNILSIVKK